MSNSAFTPVVLTVPATGTSGTGQGELNVVTNPSATTNTSGWTASTPANLSRDASGSPLDPVIPTGFSIVSTASGQTLTSDSLTVPASLRNRKLKLEFYMTQATSAFKVDVLNSSDVRFPLTTDASGASNLPALSASGKYTTYFDMDSGSSIKVRFTSIAASGTLKVTQVIVGPGIQPQGAVVGEWTNFTATLTNLGAGSFTAEARWRRVGDSIEVDVAGNKDATPGSGSTAVTLAVPLNLTIDSTKIKPSSGGSTSALGTLYTYNANTATQYITSTVQVGNGNNKVVQFLKNGSVSPLYGSDFRANCEFGIRFIAPIAEWAGSGTVQLAQNDVEYAWNSSTTTSSDTTSFGYGPQGVLFTAMGPAGLAAIEKRVRFQSAIQAGDQFLVEIQETASSSWIPAHVSYYGGALRFNDAGNVGYGIQLEQLNSTDVRVLFYSKPSSVVNWLTTARWRVRKSSAGASVGFGIVQPGTSSGLVSASGLPGNTTGNAIASGFVGEVSTTVTWNNNAWPVGAQNFATLTLNKGVWLILASGYTGTTGFRVGLSISTTSATTDTASVVVSNATTGNQPVGQTVFKFIVVSADNTPIYIVGQAYDGTTSAQGRAQAVRIA